MHIITWKRKKYYTKYEICRIGKNKEQEYENKIVSHCSGQATLTSNKVDGDFTAFDGTVEV